MGRESTDRLFCLSLSCPFLTTMAQDPRGSYRARLLRDYALVFPKMEEELKSFEIQQPKQPVRRKFLRDFDSAMYVPGYQRWCPPGPTVLLTTQEMAEAKEAGRDVMIFPAYEGEGKPWAYVCDHSNYPYVGLKLNKRLSNKLEYPLLPCCFKTPQTDPSKPTLRYEYEHPEEAEEKGGEKGRPKMFHSHKIMRRDAYGILPQDVTRFLYAINPDGDALPLVEGRFPFVRQGTIRSFNSVLDALIKTMLDYHDDIGPEEEDEKLQATMQRRYRDTATARFPILAQAFQRYELLDDGAKGSYLAKVRGALAELLPTNVTAQSAVALELRTLRDHLIRDEGYLDPRVVWRLLEEAFQVELVLFRRTTTNPAGMLGSPSFLQEYLQFKRSRKESGDRFTALLFETIGAERDHLDYPQVEVIKNFRFGADDEGQLSTNIFGWFNRTKDAPFLQRLHGAFDEIYGWDGHPAWSIPAVFTSKPQGQCADFYGKIRYLQFAEGICLLTEPLPPLDKRDLGPNPEPRCELKPVPIAKARSFLAVEGLEEGKDYRPVVVGGQLVGYQCWKRTKQPAKPLIRFYLPLVPSAAPAGVRPSPAQAPSFLAQGSLMEGFNRLARLARYLIEYVLWVFLGLAQGAGRGP